MPVADRLLPARMLGYPPNRQVNLYESLGVLHAQPSVTHLRALPGTALPAASCLGAESTLFCPSTLIRG